MIAGREFKPEGAWQRFKDSKHNPPEPLWRMRWTVVLILAAVAIFVRYG